MSKPIVFGEQFTDLFKKAGAYPEALHVLPRTATKQSAQEKRSPARDWLLPEYPWYHKGWGGRLVNEDGTPLKEISIEREKDTPFEERMDFAREELWRNPYNGMMQIKLLAKEGYPEALDAAADFYEMSYFDQNGETDGEKAFQCAKAAVDGGYEGALARLALYYNCGLGTEENAIKAAELFKKAIAAKHPCNFRHFAKACGYGIMVPSAPELAKRFLEIAIKAGDMFAFVDWIKMIDNGILPEGDTPILQAVSEGNPIAGYFIAERMLSVLMDPRYKPNGDEVSLIIMSVKKLMDSVKVGLPAAEGLLAALREDDTEFMVNGKAYTVGTITEAAIIQKHEDDTVRVAKQCLEALTRLKENVGAE